jgi:ankyrin repeat protein
MAEFYKLTCIDSSKECNIIEPISEKLKFIGAVNPITGALFNNEDIESAMQIFDSKCLNKNGVKQNCCDPQETKFKMTAEMKEKYKNSRFRLNKVFGEIKSIDRCDDLNNCKSDEWIQANPYVLCKIGDNQANVRDNVLKFESLTPNCYNLKCNKNDISFGELISGNTKSTESRAYTDLKINESISEDNDQALTVFLNKYKKTYKKNGANYILTDDNNNDTLLLRAIKKNAQKCVNLLISNGADVNIRSSDKGKSPLHYACEYGNAVVVATLINTGAKLDILDFKGQPPLFYAVRYAPVETVIYIVNQNPALLYIIDKNGNTPLHIAYKYSSNPSEVGKYLIENGVDITVKNKKGLTAKNILDKRIKDVKNQELIKNSEKFLERFETVAIAKEDKSNLENEILVKLESASSNLNMASVNANKDVYKGFITAKQNLDGPIEFDKYACNIGSYDTQKDCEKNGGHWTMYTDDDMSTQVKLEYQTNIDEDEDEDEDGKKKENPNYYKIVREKVPQKTLPFPVDHDSLMGITPSPSPSQRPSQRPSTTHSSSITPSPSTTPSSTPSTTKKSSNLYLWFIISGVIIAVILIILFYIFYLRRRVS